MPEKKKTLKDILGNRRFSVMLTSEIADNLMHMLGELLDDPDDDVDFDRKTVYEMEKTICLLDLGMHSLSTNCKVGTDECGLLKTLKHFRETFGDLIARDPDYTEDDFMYKIKP